MGLNKVAILIDGGFFKQRFKRTSGRLPDKQDVEALISVIMSLIKEKNTLNAMHPDTLLRTFYYDCEPYAKTITGIDGSTIDYSQSKTFTQQSTFLRSLDTVEQFALRLGELTFTGWKTYPNKPNRSFPDFRQKGVDMKIGLDMAWMAGKKTVDKIVLVTGDSDFIAPMKLARREGIMIYLYPMNQHLKQDLVRHADFIIGNQPPPEKRHKKVKEPAKGIEMS